MIIIKNKGIDVKIYIPKDKSDAEPATKKVNITQNGNYQLIGRNDVTVDVASMTYVEMTQAQYDSLSTKDNNTIYLIRG